MERKMNYQYQGYHQKLATHLISSANIACGERITIRVMVEHQHADHHTKACDCHRAHPAEVQSTKNKQNDEESFVEACRDGTFKSIQSLCNSIECVKQSFTNKGTKLQTQHVW